MTSKINIYEGCRGRGLNPPGRCNRARRLLNMHIAPAGLEGAAERGLGRAFCAAYPDNFSLRPAYFLGAEVIIYLEA